MFQEQFVFPSFKGAKSATIDLETHDPDLKTKGPGVRRDGYIVGAAVSVNGYRQYYPIGHNKGPNVEKEKLFGWLRSELKDFRGELLGTNFLYDMDYMAQVDIHAPHAMLRDIQIAEPLIDETQQEFSLEVQAQKYLGEGKRDQAIVELEGKDWKKRMRDIDSRLVSPYAIGDLELPERIHEIQLKKLEEEGLRDLYDLECRLMPMMLYMRRIGCPVDVAAAEKTSNALYLQALDIRKQIRHLVGFDVNVNAADSLAKAFKHLSIDFPYTAPTKGKPNGQPSFTKTFLEHHPHPLCQLIREERKALQTKGTFVDGYILDGHINGRIHCLFNQLKSDDSGTVSGRFSSSLPNLQNIPSRDGIIGPLMRGMFIPEQGAYWWARDWSQIEFRILVHYGAITGAGGAAEAVRLYHEDPDTDFHKLVATMTGLDRKAAKNVNFGMVYGMGAPKMANDMGKSIEEVEPILEQYHERVPFARQLSKGASRKAAAAGFIKTLMGRRRRFPMWEDAKWRSKAEKAKICKEKNDPKWFNPVRDPDEAREKWGGRIKRAYTHKALNGAIQGTAADLMKTAMVKIWEAGVCDVLPIHLTVHDELDGSCDGSPRAEEALKEVTHIMETVMPLKVPIRADGSSGKNWAEAK